MYSEKEIIEGCQKNKPIYQEALYKQYSRKMMGVCLRYAHSTAEAEDVFQEAFIKIFANIGQYKGGGSFEGWIRRIVVNTAINNYKKNAKYYTNVDYDQAPEPTADIESAVSKLSNEDLMRLIGLLPEGYRMVFNLYAIEGFSHKEISEMLQISEGTSKSQLHKARIVLVKLLEKNNISADA